MFVPPIRVVPFRVSPIRMVPPGVTFLHPAEQFVFIVLEFQEYHKEKCMSHTMTPGEQFVFIVLEFHKYYVH